MTRIGIVTGLTSEVGCLVRQQRNGTVDARAVGADAKRAMIAAHELVAMGCDGLISFGMAGGLDIRLEPGRVILPRRILEDDGDSYPVDSAWRERLLALLPNSFGVEEGDIVGCNHLVDSVVGKASLRATTGAVAVDMESAAVVNVAAAAGVPFIAVRAVADPATRVPEAWALDAVRPDGRVNVLAAINALVLGPGTLRGAMAMSRDSRAALKSLRGVALLAGPLFALH